MVFVLLQRVNNIRQVKISAVIKYFIAKLRPRVIPTEKLKGENSNEVKI